MTTGLANSDLQSDFARMYIAEGEALGTADAIVNFLDARGLDVSPDVRERIFVCADLNQLVKWVRMAAVIDNADELLV